MVQSEKYKHLSAPFGADIFYVKAAVVKSVLITASAELLLKILFCFVLFYCTLIQCK